MWYEYGEIGEIAIEKIANELEAVDGDGAEATRGGGGPIFRSAYEKRTGEPKGSHEAQKGIRKEESAFDMYPATKSKVTTGVHT